MQSTECLFVKFQAGVCVYVCACVWLAVLSKTGPLLMLTLLPGF